MIFITGAARSGTSLTTQILQKCGLNLGPVNPLFENLQAREGVVKPYLRGLGVDPLGQHPLPNLDKLKPAPQFREQITKAIGQKEPWGYKCAKAVLFWPLWVEHFPDASWVIVRREREDIIDSCMRTNFMSKFKTREDWGNWVDVHLERIEQMKAKVNYVEIWPRDFIAVADSFWVVADFCGLDFDPKHVTDSIKPDLYRKTG